MNDIDSVALYTDALKMLSKGGVDIFSSPNISLIVGESRAVLQTSTPEVSMKNPHFTPSDYQLLKTEFL